MTQGSLVVQLPGQLDLLTKVDIDRHQRKRSGVAVTGPALRRAQGILSLLPATMLATSLNEGPDGSVEFTWERKDDTTDIVLRMCCLPSGGLRYWYSNKGKGGGDAGGILWPSHSHEEALGRIRGILALLTPRAAMQALQPPVRGSE
jgi:hypothetical protein